MALVTVIPGIFTAPGLPTLGVNGFQDTFTRPDANILGSTEGMSSMPWVTWSYTGTVQGISGNEAYVAGSDVNGHVVAAADGKSPDGTLDLTMGSFAATAQQGVVFRGDSIDNYWRFARNATAYYRLSKFVGGANTHIEQTTDITPAPGDRLRVVLDGPSITCYVNDQQVIQHNDTDLQGLTRHGFYNNNTDANTFRGVKFTAA